MKPAEAKGTEAEAAVKGAIEAAIEAAVKEIKVPLASVAEIQRLRTTADIADAFARAAVAEGELAKLRYQQALTVLERDFGFRFTPGSSILPDGTVKLT